MDLRALTELFIVLLVVFSTITIGVIIGLCIYVSNKLTEKNNRIIQTITGLTSAEKEITAEQFLNTCNERIGKKSISSQCDFTGIYIIRNTSKNMYYVGQSKNVQKRLKAHLTGSGNGDVYADLKYGDAFTVKTISLLNSGYANLDDLERDAIRTYNAYEYGYNKNRGNRTANF